MKSTILTNKDVIGMSNETGGIVDGNYWSLTIDDDSSKNRTTLAFPLDMWAKHSIDAWPLKDLDLKIYVYDTTTWPDELRGAQSCRMQHHLDVADDPTPSNDNRISDIGLIQLFQTYPGRVYNPAKADIFVVPYPHASHCFSKCLGGSYLHNCGGLPQRLVDDLIDKHLEWFQDEKIERHLFLLSTSHMLNRKLQMAPLKFVIGPRIYKLDRPSIPYLPRMNPRHKSNPQQLGNFIIPYMNTHPWMQPIEIQSRPDSWWTRSREYSFVYLFGGKNKRTKDDPRIHRRRFERYVTTRYNRSIVGGMPYIMEAISEKRSPEEIFEMYQNAVFCPCLPGDTVTQKRFFDAILNGCLPVVLRFSHGKEWTWHPFENSKLRNSLPFAHDGQFDTNLQINYSDFVIEVDLPTSNLVKEMEEWLQPERAQELKRRQESMKEATPLLTYGLGPWAHTYEDAFSTLVRGLKKYTDELPARFM